MTRCERVKAAMAHKEPDKVPSCVHLARDGWEIHGEKLYERYVDEKLRNLCDEGKISRQHAIY